MKPQNQQRQRQIPPVLHASIFPRPRLRSAQGLSRLSASLPPLARHCVALTNPSALLSLLRYGKNERKKMGGGTPATPKAKPCILRHRGKTYTKQTVRSPSEIEQTLALLHNLIETQRQISDEIRQGLATMRANVQHSRELRRISEKTRQIRNRRNLQSLPRPAEKGTIKRRTKETSGIPASASPTNSRPLPAPAWSNRTSPPAQAGEGKREKRMKTKDLP